MVKLKINCDGGARGNPGPAGVGIVIQIRSTKHEIRNKSKIQNQKLSKYIGVATNNQAEYQAVIEALKYLNENFAGQAIQADFLLDSQLVVEQLNGNYKLKNEGLKPLFSQIQELMVKIGGEITFTFIPRQQNKAADKLVNEAIDKELNKNV